MKERNLNVLRFSVGKDEYALRINEVKEVIRMIIIKEVPRLPKFIKGVFSLRGQIVMVVNLRERFGFEINKYSKSTRIVIAEINSKYIGFIVDSVDKIEELPGNIITPASDYPVKIDDSFIYGIYKSGENIIPVLSIEGILSEEELDILSSVKIEDELIHNGDSEK